MATAYDVAKRATEVFCTFTDEKPNLVDLGIPAVADVVGGMGPGTLCCLAAATGVGKSNFSLSMLTNSRHVGADLSWEDPEDLIGVRLLAQETGIRALDIRKDNLTPEQRKSVREALERLRDRKPIFESLVSAPLDKVVTAVKRVGDQGARFVILDYLQKIRGVSDDRRSEVGHVMTAFQRACVDAKMVPIMASQLVRSDPTKAPSIRMLKESGDIENEARLILLGHQDPDDRKIVRWRIAKSPFGGAGTYFEYRYNNAGVLEPHNGLEDSGEF